MSGQAGRLAGLDGVRALAVLAVFAHHMGVRLPGLGFVDLGALGVWTFFVLSGFLVAPIAFDTATRARSDAARRLGAVRFLMRRVLRIAPIYYLVLSAFLLVSLATKGHEAVAIYRDAAAALWSYTTNVHIGHEDGRWLGPFSHLWSLAIEFQFYLLLAAALALAPGDRIGAVMMVAAAAVWIWAGWTLATVTPHLPVYVSSVVGFAMMALGGAARFALRDDRVARHMMHAWLAPTSAVALVLTHVLLQAADLARVTFVTTPLIAALLLSAMTSRPGAVARLLEWRPLRLLGVVSYGFYLYHLFVIVAVQAVLEKLGDRFGEDLSRMVGPTALMGSIVGTALSWRLIEQPLQKWTARLTSPGPPAAEPTAPNPTGPVGNS